MLRAALIAVFALTLTGFQAAVAQSERNAATFQAAIDPELIYRMNEDEASFSSGCFSPCACPLVHHGQVRGTFVLGPLHVGDVFDFREVREVNWFVVSDTNVRRITGSGVYRRTNYGKPFHHALELTLSIDGQPPATFFSDAQPVAGNDPSIELVISMNGLDCHDTVIEVSASPVARSEILQYQVQSRTSTFQQGCFDPCDCLLESPRPMRGTFTLVPIFQGGTYLEYAVVRLRINVLGKANSDQPAAITGFGRYTLIQGVAGPMQAMELELSIDGGDFESFDQELENIEPIFPRISITVDMNNHVCFDRVLRINALAARSN